MSKCRCPGCLAHARRRAALWVARAARPEPVIRGHELPPYIVTFEGLTLPYGELGL